MGFPLADRSSTARPSFSSTTKPLASATAHQPGSILSQGGPYRNRKRQRVLTLQPSAKYAPGISRIARARIWIGAPLQHDQHPKQLHAGVQPPVQPDVHSLSEDS